MEKSSGQEMSLNDEILYSQIAALKMAALIRLSQCIAVVA